MTGRAPTRPEGHSVHGTAHKTRKGGSSACFGGSIGGTASVGLAVTLAEEEIGGYLQG